MFFSQPHSFTESRTKQHSAGVCNPLNCSKVGVANDNITLCCDAPQRVPTTEVFSQYLKPLHTSNMVTPKPTFTFYIIMRDKYIYGLF